MAAPQFVLASPATLAELVSRLPAEARAQVAWTPKRIADMATVLLTDPLLPEGVIESAVDAYLETGIFDRPHRVGATFSDIRPREQCAIKQRLEAVMFQYRSARNLFHETGTERPLDCAAGMVRSETEKKRGASLVFLQQFL